MRKEIVFLASGNGGTLKFLCHAIERLSLDLEITGVIADRPCGALEFASKVSIPNFEIFYKRSNPIELRNALSALSPDLIVTNFHKIIDEGTLALFPDAFINLHYSLLPAFGGMIGMETIAAAEKVNAKFVGASCHKVTAKVDAGELISQSVTPVYWGDIDHSMLINAVFRAACLTFLIGILKQNIKSNSTDICGFDFTFNPGFPFSTDLFDEPFWEIIKQA